MASLVSAATTVLRSFEPFSFSQHSTGSSQNTSFQGICPPAMFILQASFMRRPGIADNDAAPHAIGAGTPGTSSTRWRASQANGCGSPDLCVPSFSAWWISRQCGGNRYPVPRDETAPAINLVCSWFAVRWRLRECAIKTTGATLTRAAIFAFLRMPWRSKPNTLPDWLLIPLSPVLSWYPQSQERLTRGARGTSR